MADDQNPPQITTGSFVSWANGKGRVDLVVTTGKVPGVDGDVEATSESPAARVVVWRDGKPTREKIGASTHTLRRIAPLDKDEKSDPVAALVSMQREHVEHEGLPETAALTGEAIKSAYDRGIMAWPGDDVTTLTPTEWALGRAAHLCKAARGEAEALNDADLLHPGHALYKGEQAVQEPTADSDATEQEPEGEEVVLDAAEVESMLASIQSETAAPAAE